MRFPRWQPAQPVSVSVCVQAYQHAAYIAQCLEAICHQQGGLDYEVLVGEDQSSDGTREICLDFARRYPDKIRLVLHDRSNLIRVNGLVTGRFNLLTNLRRARGRYIALCDGDDYWTDPLKLQRQVEFLDSHPDHMFVYHNAIEVDARGEPTGRMLLRPQHCNDRPRERVVAGDGMPTSSVMFRRELVDRLPEGYTRVMNADTYLFCYGGQFGRAGYIDVQPSGYRIHDGGIWSKRSRLDKLQSNLHTFQTLFPDMQPRYRPIVGYQICRGYNRVICRLAGQGRLIHAARWTAEYLYYAATRFGMRAPLFQIRWLGSWVRNLMRGRSSGRRR